MERMSDMNSSRPVPEENRRGFRGFLRQQRNTVLLTALLTLVCYGHHAFTLNIDIDTETLFLNSRTNVDGWLQIGRFGAYYTKELLDGFWYNPFFSGVLFLAVFFLTAVSFSYLLWREDSSLPLWAFATAFVTAPLWCFMFFFSMLQTEMVIGLLCGVCCLSLLFGMMGGEERGKEISQGENGTNRGLGNAGRILRWIAALLLLFWSMACYQSNLVFYLTGAVGLYLIRFRKRWEESRSSGKETVKEILLLALHFLAAYALYSLVTSLFFSEGTYLTGQKNWGTEPFLDTLFRSLRAVRELLFRKREITTLLPVFLLLMAAADGVRVLCRKGKGLLGKLFALLLLAAAFAAPFALMFYLGTAGAYRTWYPLVLAEAILLTFFLGQLPAWRSGEDQYPGRSPKAEQLPVWRSEAKKILPILAMVFVFLIGYQQTSMNLRLWYTDDVAFRQASQVAERITADLDELGLGESPTEALVFLGKKEMPLDGSCHREEMFGATGFAWDEQSSVGVTNRAVDLINVLCGREYHPGTEEDFLWGREAAGKMPCYPVEGYIRLDPERGVILIRLE